MTAVVAVPAGRTWPVPAVVRLFWLELRHNTMAWAVPLACALFWLITFRKVAAMPPLWNVRAALLQTGTVLDFIVPVTGAAAWMGGRESRRRTADVLATTPVPRAARLLVVWAATTCWALAGYLICVGPAYWVTAARAGYGGPLWWPVAVSAACMPAFAAIGLGAATLLPSRFTAPAVAVVAFFAIALSTELINGSQSAWQVSPLVSWPWDTGPDTGVATFYPYQPDLAIAQLMLLAGGNVAILAAIVLPGSARRLTRVIAAGAAATGLVTAGTAAAVTGTGRLGPTGMITIPALHDAARDRPLHVTPVCSGGPIPVCMNPAYAMYLPPVSASLRPLLTELAGLPGAPVRISQSATRYQQGRGNLVEVTMAGPQVSGRPAVFHFLLPDQTEGPVDSSSQLVSQAAGSIGPALVADITGARQGANLAQDAVAGALLMLARAHPVGGRPGTWIAGLGTNRALPVVRPGTPGYAAAVRFAALSPAARRVWLVRHLPSLRAGRITLADLP